MAKTTQLSQHRRWCSCEEESHSVQDTGPEDWVAWPGMYNWVETTQSSQDPALLCHHLPARHALSPHQSTSPCTAYPAGSRLTLQVPGSPGLHRRLPAQTSHNKLPPASCWAGAVWRARARSRHLLSPLFVPGAHSPPPLIFLSFSFFCFCFSR